MSSTNDQPLLINQLPLSVDFPIGDDRRFKETLTLAYKRIVNTVNTKEGGLFSAQEYFSSQQYSLSDPSTFKNVYRKCFDMVEANGDVPIPAGTSVSTDHGITGLSQVVHMYGGALTSGGRSIPLPYVSATLVTNQVEIYILGTKVILLNGASQLSLTKATIVVEYLKN